MRDLAGAAWGVLLFATAAVAPGYCLAHTLDPAAFRARGLREQLAWSLALSFGPGVLLIVAAVWLGGATVGALLLLALAAAAVWLFRKYPPRVDITPRQAVLTAVTFAVWACLVLFSLVDIGTHNHLWMSVTVYDHGWRTAFTDAVLRTGLPPVDPVFWPGHDAPMRYYYFWYAVCAAVARLAHLSARQALIASCVWPLPGVVALLALFGRYVLGRRGRELTRLTLTASALLFVTGLDILVTLALHLLGTPVLADMEWWSIDQVASWADTFLWVPHHAAALVASLTGILLLHLAAKAGQPRTRVLFSTMAGFSLAASFGMSAYLAIGAAITLLGWLLVNVRRKLAWRSLQALALATVTAAVTLSGFLWQLTRAEGTTHRSASPLYFGLREILSPVVLAAAPLFHSVAANDPWRARELAASILLLPGWGVELGFFAVVLLAALGRVRRLEPGSRTVLWLTLSGLAAASFVRSGVILTNDYGIRAALLPQFFLLLLGAIVFTESTGAFRRFLTVLMVVGVAGCVYQLVLLRTYLPWQQAHGNPEVQGVGERTYALREAYAAMQSRIPVGARIQYDPSVTSFFLYPHPLFANRQLITAEASCSTAFGGDRAACPPIQDALAQLFPPSPALTPVAPQAQSLCRQIGAQFLVVTRWDAAWQARSAWPGTLPAAVDQPSVRVLACAP